ncbi:Elongator complex protein 4 [Anas platyrhynchos]|uniref:Elongator complex protein 4 n=1 Tax=Anas platyrhynchos TaxID=8839 RepID=R0L1N8_ANAPL|nr:Elongator complex protein 4 [Anas platyrhynchos]
MPLPAADTQSGAPSVHLQRLHLPPDLSDTVSRSSKQDLAESAKLLSSGCGAMAIGKKHLDF